MAEVLLNHLGEGRYRAFSAGSRPAAGPNPMALEVLSGRGLPSEGLRSKSWDEFSGPGAAEMDIVITICDSAAAEACPAWPGHPVQVHWGFPDPALAAGDDEEKRTVYRTVFAALESQFRYLAETDLESLDGAAMKELLQSMAPSD